jgi:iron complex outermembrane receptor protein
MKIGVLIAALLLCSCGSPSTSEKFSEAQRIVDQIVAKHPALVRLTIHAVPAGETESRIIACNIRNKIGKISDPEDLHVMSTKQAVVLREGTNLDVTMPILNKAGTAMAATGITIKDEGNRSEAALLKEADEIAEELTDEIQAMKKLPW